MQAKPTEWRPSDPSRPRDANSLSRVVLPLTYRVVRTLIFVIFRTIFACIFPFFACVIYECYCALSIVLLYCDFLHLIVILCISTCVDLVCGTMGPKKVSASAEDKRKVVRSTIELKKEIIAKYESGVRVSNLALQYNMPKSTISTFLKNKEAIKAADVAVGVSALSKQRPQSIEEMEKLLLIWIKKRSWLATV